MWKQNFSDYATGIAFNVQLSKAMCDTLITLSEYREKIIDNFVLLPHWSHRGMIALERRGLIEHVDNKYRVTEAGRMVYCLVRIAFDNKEKSNFKNTVAAPETTG